jgi:hypothetical protein
MAAIGDAEGTVFIM